MRLAWRVDSLDSWRKDLEADRERFRRDVAAEFAELRGEIEAVTKAQEIAAAVSAELAKSPSAPAQRVAEAVAERGTKLTLTWWQKLGGFVMGAIVVIDAIRGLIS
jgi:hypothetical protein